MSCDVGAIQKILASYLSNCIELKIVNYLNDSNPAGVGLGINIDKGETHSFDLSIKNNGSLGLRNVIVRVTSTRGKVTQTYFGSSSIVGGHWIGPFSNSIDVRPFDLNPHQHYLHQHNMSGGHLIGYNAEDTTAGSDNNRAIETLLTAQIVQWEPDFGADGISGKGPKVTFESFIQRS